MSTVRRPLKTLLLAATAVAGLALVASGCCHRRAHAWAHYKKMGPHGMGFAAGCGGACKAKKGMKLGAPKLLCPKKLIMHAKWLNLTDDQVKKLEAIKKAAKEKKGDLRLAKKRVKVALKAEWLKDQPDPAKIRELATALAQVKQQKIAAKADVLLQTKDVLTAEQWKKILTAPCKKGCGGKGCMGCPGCKGKGPGMGHGPHGRGPGPGMGHGPHGKPPCAHCVK